MMSKKTQPLYKDLLVPIDEIERGWMRIPATLITCIPVLALALVVYVCHGLYCGVRDWYHMYLISCLKGKK